MSWKISAFRSPPARLFILLVLVLEQRHKSCRQVSFKTGSSSIVHQHCWDISLLCNRRLSSSSNLLLSEAATIIIMDVVQLVKRAGGGSSGGEDQSHRFVDHPSLGHELGVMFGGMAAMVLSMGLFWIWWGINLKREKKLEAKRIEGLRQRGILKEQLPQSSDEEPHKTG
ncbi:hypothetical protein BC567DRAFT_225603 [Phyllosticta citribraziliensis]